MGGIEGVGTVDAGELFMIDYLYASRTGSVWLRRRREREFRSV